MITTITHTTEVETMSAITPATSFKEIAIPLAERGIQVTPLAPRSKIAVLNDWPNLATTDLEQITKWHQENPNYNVGAVAKLNNFWFLDCDVPDLQEAIEKETGEKLPPTFCVKSGKGRHLYFRHTEASRSLKRNRIQLKDQQGKVLGDVQFNNAYVVGPGSIHPSGKRYEVVSNSEILEAPDWLVKWIKERHQHAECDEQQHFTSEAKIKKGGRDNFLFKQACRLRDTGLPKPNALTALLSINQNKCEPPLSELIVNQKIESAFKEKPGTATTIEEPLQKVEAAPLPPVDGSALLRSLEEYFTRYAVLEKGVPLVLSLWSMATHLFASFDTFGYLAVTSPTKRCGKSRVGELLELICANAENTVEISPAALFRIVQEKKPTLILEEAECLSGKGESTEALRAILNVGYRKGKKVRRSAKKNEDGSFQVEEFDTFCPKVIILIGSLPDTLSDRCIPIRMRRRTNETLARFRFAVAREEAAPVKDKMAGWAAANAEKVNNYYLKNDVPFVSDREAELWLPLFSVLTIADPTRLAELESTAVQISNIKSANEPTERSIKLLADLRQIFAGQPSEAGQLTSQTILTALRRIEDSPWKDWGKGKGLSARNLAELLRPYEIRPQNMRTEKGRVVKAYKKDSFKDAWERYLPPVTPPGVKPQPITSNEHPDDAKAATPVTDLDKQAATKADSWGESQAAFEAITLVRDMEIDSSCAACTG